MVNAVRGHRALTKLGLGDNRIGRSGCTVLADLLQDPQCTLKTLDLYANQLDNDCILAIATSLANNTSLETLNIEENFGITNDNWWEAFSEVLCNSSSVYNTYSSNHTLSCISYNEDEYNEKLEYYLDLNGNSDKKEVATLKILRNHKHFDMKPFFASDLKFFPVVLSWFEAAKEYDECDECDYDINEMMLSVMYQFTHDFPWMFVNLGNVSLGGGNVPLKSKALSSCEEGSLIPITLTQPGPLGFVVQRVGGVYALIVSVNPGSQAERMGVQKGDIPVSIIGGKRSRIPFDDFLRQVKTETRPVSFNVVRSSIIHK